MPKTVFQLFWSRLKQGKATFAYIKNKSRTGKYYWVLATVFPVPGGYLSVRIKPTSEILANVETIYAELCRLESTKGMNEAGNLLLERLAGLGFSTYDKFMIAALSKESWLRNKSMETEALSGSQKTLPRAYRKLDDLSEYCDLAALEINKTNAQVSKVHNQTSKYLVHSEKIRNACLRLKYLSANMSITAHKFGKEGASLAVVAQSYQTATQRIQSKLDYFSQSLTDVVQNLDHSLTDVLCMKIQIEMISFEIHQAMNQVLGVESSEEFTISMRLENIRSLMEIVKEYFTKANERVGTYFELIGTAKEACDSIAQTLLNIDLIKTGGLVEGSRTEKVEQAFQPFMAELAAIVKNVQDPVIELQDLFRSMSGAFSDALAYSRRTEFYLVRSMELFDMFLASKMDGKTKNQESAA